MVDELCRPSRVPVSEQALPLRACAKSSGKFGRMMLDHVQGDGWRTKSRGNEATAYVLDDEPGIAALVARALKLAGLDVKHFTDPASCMSLIRIRPPQLLVLDLALGKTDAVELIRQLEALCFRGKILLMSGVFSAILQDIERIGMKHGLAMLRPLQKPFGLSDVHDRIKEMKAAAKSSNGVRLGKKPHAAPEHRVDLADALRKNWLELWYQPKISLRGLTVSGGEALIRARHPDFGVLNPGQFLPRPGDPLYLPLSGFVLHRALANWRALAETGVFPKLAVNIPPSSLMVAELMAVIRKVLPSDRRFPGLIVEVTEDDVINDADRMREIVLQLQLMGVRISIDDFGKGYSSFERLTLLPFSEIKLSGCFVQGSASDEVKQRICRSAIELARLFNATVCAEGVEEAEDLRVMMSMGCDDAQGYLFAKPMPFEDFAKMLQTKSQCA
jgi:EAL domain-containing protein (putative c-di-GMP-specific phosphodiesterase class I)/ActR/RegA family two-component response regulator